MSDQTHELRGLGEIVRWVDQQRADNKPETISLNGRDYIQQGGYDSLKWVEQEPILANVHHFGTLTGLVGWAKHNADDHDLELAYFEVGDRGNTVLLCLPAVGDRRRAATVALAESEGRREGGMNCGVGHAIKVLMVNYEENSDRDELIALLSKISFSEGIEVSDDGVSQEVVVRENAAMVNRASSRPLWDLIPRTTFPEVAQPVYRYVLRLSKGDGTGNVSLTEMQTGLEGLEAASNVAAKVREIQSGVGLDLPVFA